MYFILPNQYGTVQFLIFIINNFYFSLAEENIIIDFSHVYILCIYIVQPYPFCIVDTGWDELKVVRAVSEYVKKSEILFFKFIK